MNAQIQGFQEPLLLRLISAIVMFYIWSLVKKFAEPL